MLIFVEQHEVAVTLTLTNHLTCLMSPTGVSIVGLMWTLTVKLSIRSAPPETQMDGFPT